LDVVQQNDLHSVLEKHPVQFNNKLGHCPDELIHLDLRNDVVHHAAWARTVPHNHRDVFKAGLDGSVRIGVLKEGSWLEWTTGTFVIPKKLLPGKTTPGVSWTSDFHGLNGALKKMTCPIPCIGDIPAK
jgi:hypothetical protein